MILLNVEDNDDGIIFAGEPNVLVLLKFAQSVNVFNPPAALSDTTVPVYVPV